MTIFAFASTLLLGVTGVAAAAPTALQPKAITPLPLGTIVPTGCPSTIAVCALSTQVSRISLTLRFPHSTYLQGTAIY